MPLLRCIPKEYPLYWIAYWFEKKKKCLPILLYLNIAHHLIRFICIYPMHSLNNILYSFLSVCIALNVGKRQVHFHLVVRFSLSFVLCIVFFVQHPKSLNYYCDRLGAFFFASSPFLLSKVLDCAHILQWIA